MLTVKFHNFTFVFILFKDIFINFEFSNKYSNRYEHSRDSMTFGGNENPRHLNKKRLINIENNSKNILIGRKRR
jgi:type II restriction/modification system DNA methylase subunit YeeA